MHDLGNLVTASAFLRLIGASRSQFDLLVADGMLRPALDAAGVKAVWNPKDGIAFLECLLVGATQLRQAQHGWVHISRSAQKLKIRPSETIAAIRDRRITRIGNHMDHEGYAAVYVYHPEVTRVLGSEEPTAQTIEFFAKSVGMRQPSRMRRLIMDGHTPATLMANPRTKALQYYLTREDAEAFHEPFFTSRTMALALGRSWQSLNADLRRKSIMPFSPNDEDYGILYLRKTILSRLG